MPKEHREQTESTAIITTLSLGNLYMWAAEKTLEALHFIRPLAIREKKGLSILALLDQV